MFKLVRHTTRSDTTLVESERIKIYNSKSGKVLEPPITTGAAYWTLEIPRNEVQSVIERLQNDPYAPGAPVYVHYLNNPDGSNAGKGIAAIVLQRHTDLNKRVVVVTAQYDTAEVTSGNYQVMTIAIDRLSPRS